MQAFVSVTLDADMALASAGHHHLKSKSRIRKNPAAFCLALQHSFVTALQYRGCNAARKLIRARFQKEA